MIRVDAADVIAALRDLQTGADVPLQQFDWNQGWVHGYAARDVALALSLGRRQEYRAVTWAEVFPVLEELAGAGEVVRVLVSRGRRKGSVPVYRTVGA